MEFLYLPFNIFVFFPPLAFLVAFAFLILLLKFHKKANSFSYLLLITSLLWVIYGIWEIKMFYWSKTVIAPIRIDLLLIVPFLYIISGLGIYIYCRIEKVSNN